jgi:hypothetical protein
VLYVRSIDSIDNMNNLTRTVRRLIRPAYQSYSVCAGTQTRSVVNSVLIGQYRYIQLNYNIVQKLHTSTLLSADTEQTSEFTPRGDSLDEAIRALGDMFGECRMDIDDARESIGTTYYSDDALNAQQSVDAVMKQWLHCQSLATVQSNDVLNRLKQSWALKLEQLKGEYQQMSDEANDHD